MGIRTKRNKRHPAGQIVRKIQQADQILAEGDDVEAVLCELDITEAKYQVWGHHSGGLKAEDAKKLEALEKKNLQLKRLLAEAELETAVLK